MPTAPTIPPTATIITPRIITHIHIIETILGVGIEDTVSGTDGIRMMDIVGASINSTADFMATLTIGDKSNPSQLLTIDLGFLFTRVFYLCFLLNYITSVINNNGSVIHWEIVLIICVIS